MEQRFSKVEEQRGKGIRRGEYTCFSNSNTSYGIVRAWLFDKKEN